MIDNEGIFEVPTRLTKSEGSEDLVSDSFEAAIVLDKYGLIEPENFVVGKIVPVVYRDDAGVESVIGEATISIVDDTKIEIKTTHFDNDFLFKETGKSLSIERTMDTLEPRVYQEPLNSIKFPPRSEWK